MYATHAKALSGVETSFIDELEEKGKQIRKQKSKNKLKHIRQVFQKRNHIDSDSSTS